MSQENEYHEDNLGRLEYNEQQECYHRAETDDASIDGWQAVCVAHSDFIDAFRVKRPELRGSFSQVQAAFAQFAGPLALIS